MLGGVKPGSIVLFHNAAEHTPEALAGIIESLQAEGYEFVPISELLLEGETTIYPDGTQKPAAPLTTGKRAMQTGNLSWRGSSCLGNLFSPEKRQIPTPVLRHWFGMTEAKGFCNAPLFRIVRLFIPRSGSRAAR